MCLVEASGASAIILVRPASVLYSSRPLVDHAFARRGEVSERLKEHAWKVCKRVIPLRGFESRSLRHLVRVLSLDAGVEPAKFENVGFDKSAGADLCGEAARRARHRMCRVHPALSAIWFEYYRLMRGSNPRKLRMLGSTNRQEPICAAKPPKGEAQDVPSTSRPLRHLRFR